MIIHVVEPGETLWGIADAYQVSLEELMRDNGIYPNHALVVGQAIVILTPEDRFGAKRMIVTTGYAYPFIDQGVLESSLASLTSLNIFSYGFTREGDLITIDDEDLIRLARAYGTAPVLVLTPMDETLSFSTELAGYLLDRPEIQTRLIENVLHTMWDKGYTSVDVDFEYINPEQGGLYEEFLRRLTRRLNEFGLTVSVALAPKDSADMRGLLYEAHDYRRIGEIVNIALLMTYEWGYSAGPPMAVSPIQEVRRVLDYAVTEMSRGKILMGIPNYGYDWTLPFVQGVTVARSLGNQEAVRLAANTNSRIEYDETAQAPFFNYYDSTGRQHVVWFEDARSIQAKLDLVLEYGILGAGYWSLMKPFTQNWTVLNTDYEVVKRTPL